MIYYSFEHEQNVIKNSLCVMFCLHDNADIMVLYLMDAGFAMIVIISD